MQAAIEALNSAIASEHDDRKKMELRRGLEALMRQEEATDLSERPDFRSPDFKQIANEPESGEELGEAIARTNRMEGELPRTAKIPTGREKTPPPVEAGKINVDVDGDNGRRTVTVEGGGQPSKPADVPAHSDAQAQSDKKE